MAGKKYVFIIPGFGQQPTQKGYVTLKKLLKKGGFSPIPVALVWKNRTVSENTELFLKTYQTIRKKRDIHFSQVYVLGFSYGAMIAFLASTKIRFAGLILCSLSPFFSEDLPKKIPYNLSLLQEKRIKDFSSLKHSVLSKKIKTKKIIMLYGKKEATSLKKRVTATFKKVTVEKKFLFPIPKTQHNIADKNYLYTLHTAAKEIL